MKELKPCPFCGGEGRMNACDTGGKYYTIDLRSGVIIRGLQMDHRAVVCAKCGAKTKVYAKERNASNAWNRREYNG